MGTLQAGSIAQYFAESDISIGSSNYLDMCAQAVHLSHTSVECRACGGMGFKGLEPEEMAKRYRRIGAEKDPDRLAQLRRDLWRDTICRACKGGGYTTMKRADMATAMDKMFTTVRCGRCRGCGESFPPNDTTAEREDRCLQCWGQAYIVPVTAKETQRGSNNGGGGGGSSATDDGDDHGHTGGTPHSLANEDAIVRRGTIGRALDGIRQQDPVVGAAIASYFGLDGDKWGSHKWGRVFALWQHTEAGLQLAKEGAERSRAGHGFLMKPLDLIASERDAEFREPPSDGKDRWRDRRRALIGAADRQARDLLARMNAAIEKAEAA